MSKKTKKQAFASGAISVNGDVVASTQKKKNKVKTSYNMSDTEKDIFNGIQDNLSYSLENLFNISDEKQNEWKKELDTYKANGINEINSIYTPMINDLRDNISSRFGNLDNSIFMDNLNEITDKQAKAVANLSDELITKEQDMYTQEMKNRMNYITLLSNLNTAMNDNIINYMQASNSNSSLGNNYNLAGLNNNSYNALGNIISAIGKAGSSIMSYL